MSRGDLRARPVARLAVRAGALLIGGLLGLPLPHRAAAADWPTRPIKLINALAAGSAPDLLSRIIAQPLSRALGQPVVVDNRPGAANVIATQAAARAAPDGYTLFFGPSLALAVNPHTFKSLPYDPLADFTYIAMVSKAAIGSCARRSWSNGWASSVSTSTAPSPRRQPASSCAASATSVATSCARSGSCRNDPVMTTWSRHAYGV